MERRGYSKDKIIDFLILENRFDEAFEVAQKIPDQSLQVEKKILINLRQSEY